MVLKRKPIDKTPNIHFILSPQPNLNLTSKLEKAELDAVVQTLGLIIYNELNQCWLSERDKTETINESFTVISTCLSKEKTIRFAIKENELKVNDKTLQPNSTLEKTLVKHMNLLQVNNFLFEAGLTKEEFVKFIELLTSSPDEVLKTGSFYDAVETAGFKYIHSKKVILKEVAEDETVISQKDLQAAEIAKRARLTDKAIEYLVSGKDITLDVASEALHAVADDAKKMADVIIEAAKKVEIPSETFIEKGHMAKVVAQSIQRAFERLMAHPASKTQKGRKLLERIFRQLEAEIFSKMGLNPSDPDSQIISKAIERATETLKVNAIADEYFKKLKALEEAEKHILKFIKLYGVDKIYGSELAIKLQEGNIDINRWHKLLASIPSETSVSDEERAAVAVQNLAKLLNKLETVLLDTKEQKTPQTITDELKHVQEELGIIVSSTQKRIENLAEEIKEEITVDTDVIESPVSKPVKRKGLSKQQIVKILAEIVQEICQPLSVIDCAMTMILSGRLGSIPDTCSEMLKLATNSSVRIHQIVKSLEKLAGQPTELIPDKDIQKAIYSEDINKCINET